MHNACTTWWGTPNTITGAATVNDRRTDAQLHVSFPGVPFQDNPDGPTNYVITDLAHEGYEPQALEQGMPENETETEYTPLE